MWWEMKRGIEADSIFVLRVVEAAAKRVDLN